LDGGIYSETVVDHGWNEHYRLMIQAHKTTALAESSSINPAGITAGFGFCGINAKFRRLRHCLTASIKLRRSSGDWLDVFEIGRFSVAVWIQQEAEDNW